jgi:hypothetical protein
MPDTLEAVGPTEYWMRARELIDAGLVTLYECWGLAGLNPQDGKPWPNQTRSKVWAWGSHLMKLERAAQDAARQKGVAVPEPGVKHNQAKLEAQKRPQEDPLEGPWTEVAARLGIQSIAALHLHKLLQRKPYQIDALKKALGHVTQAAVSELVNLGLAEYNYTTGEVRNVPGTRK